MTQLDSEQMMMDEKRFVDDLIRASIFDIVKAEEISKFIEYDICTVYDNGMTFLPHHCNNTCLVNNPDRKFSCQKLDNVRVSNDNEKHQFMPLTNDYLVTCLKILQRIRLTEEIYIDADLNVLSFKFSIPFFHPYLHVPPTDPTNDASISPVEGCIFQYSNQCIIFKYSQAEVVVPNMYASIL